jgi:mannosylglycerate hydrolase
MQRIFVVSHTHWDREWYEPFQVFRVRLIRCIDKLLDILVTEPAYQYFLLDGQTIVLEDYLEVRPDREQTLRDLVSAGRIHVGPWYVLPDEFLVSGEAIIRNLLRGMRRARHFGGTMRVGYLPDPFGHISQMPQILRGVGLSAAAFRRGLADEPTELWWQAPDGTRVLACYLRDGYDNAAWMQHDDAGFVRDLIKRRESLAPHATTSNILLMNGTDHMEPWAELPRRLETARRQIEDAQIMHASLPMYVDAVQAEIAQRQLTLPVVEGELRNPKRHHLLPGVASTRMWIKQRNAHAQMLLEKWAEPFAAWAALEIASRKEKAGKTTLQSPISSLQPLINTAWKYLLQNHPHDSICGCGVDRTHADMAPRFDWVEQIADQVIEASLAEIAAAANTQAFAEAVPLIVFNPVEGPRTDRVAATIEAPGSMENFVLLDEEGHSVPYQISRQRVEEYYRMEATAELIGTLLAMAQDGRVLGMAIQDAFIRADENPIRVDVTLTSQGEPNLAILKAGLPRIQQVISQNGNATFDVRAHSPTKIEIEFVARDVPGYGYRIFSAKPAGRGQTQANADTENLRQPATPRAQLAIENEFLRVEPNQDDGTLSVIDKSTGVTYSGANRFVDGGDRGDLYNYNPPENDMLIAQPSAPPEIAIERGAARQSLRLAMNYRLPAQLSADRSSRATEMVDVPIVTTVSLYPGVRRIDVHTQVDNRARDHRLRVEFPTSLVTAYANADQAFDVVTRSLDLPKDTADWIEQPRPEAPMQCFASIHNDQTGLTLATRGLPEYEARRDAAGVTLALTLLRCTGWLSRNDLSMRSEHAGPALETPGAQEIGVHAFEYALIPHAGDWRHAIDEAHAFAAPMRAVVTDAHPGALPSAASLVAASPRAFVISAIKQAEDDGGLVVRGYNSSSETIEVTLRVFGDFARAARANLNEESLAPLELRDGCEATLKVRGKEIVTLKLEA